MRPLSSADIATLNPSPSAPSIASAGTRTPSRESSAVSCARSPSFPFIGLASKPSEPVGTRNALIPFGPVAARAREDDRGRGPAAERDEDLRAGQHPLVAVALGPGRERGGIGAAAGLGERVAAERVAARERAAGAPASAPPSPTSRPSCRRARSRRRRSRGPTSPPCRAPRRAGSTRPSRARRRRAPPAGRRRGSPPRRACRRARAAAPRPRPSRGRAARARARRARAPRRGSAPARM